MEPSAFTWLNNLTRVINACVNRRDTVVWEKFIVGNFHVKKICVKIFSSSWVADENFLTVNNYLVEVLPLVLLHITYKVLCEHFIQAPTHGL